MKDRVCRERTGRSDRSNHNATPSWNRPRDRTSTDVQEQGQGRAADAGDCIGKRNRRGAFSMWRGRYRGQQLRQRHSRWMKRVAALMGEDEGSSSACLSSTLDYLPTSSLSCFLSFPFVQSESCVGGVPSITVRVDDWRGCCYAHWYQ